MCKKTLCLLFAILILCVSLFLCGCQKTPSEEYVVNKGDNNAEKKVEAGALPGGMGAQPVFPAHWDDDIKTDYKELVINADLVLTEQDGCPVHLVKRHAFSPDEMAKYSGEFFDGVTGILKGSKRTREEYEEAMSLVTGMDLPDESREIQLDMLRGEWESAPGKEDFIPTSALSASDFKDDSYAYISYMVRQSDENTGVFARAYGGGSLTMSIRSLSVVQPKDIVESDGGYIGEKDAVVNAEIPLGDAVSAAEEFFLRIGAEGFSLANSIESRLFDGCRLEVISTGWDLHFMRSFGYSAINTAIHDGDGVIGAKDEENDYNSKWRCEWIEVYVSGNGVEYFTWNDPVDDLGVVNENVELMDFSSLSKTISRYYTARLGNPKQPAGFFYMIDRLVLTAIPLQKKNSNEAYMMPVWVCDVGMYESIADWMSCFRLPGGEKEISRFTIAFSAVYGTRVTVPIT